MKSPSQFPRSREAQITALLMRHRAALFGYILSCVPHAADAEDILQEVSLTATTRFDQLREDAGFLPWVIEIARRKVLAHQRKVRRQAVLEPEVVGALADDAVAAAVAREEQADRTDALLGCLDQLPAHSAELIRKRYDDSFRNIEDLAASLGRTVSATYALLKRIRLTLRDCVARKMAAEGAS